MSDKKLTDEEIIKTLERCSKGDGCFGCAKAYAHSANCIRILETECLDLINRQKSEIERLKECPKCVYEYDGEVTEYCVQGPCSNFKTVEQIKAEAYKEFAERIKMSIKANVVETLCNDVKGVYNAEYVLDDIDNLLKEMVGN